MRYVLTIILCGIVAAVSIRVYALYQAQNAARAARGVMAVSVQVDTVEGGAVRDIGKFYGTLEARYRFEVAPKIAGRLVKLAVMAGDRLEPGQPIARIDDDELKLAVAESQAALAVAEATFAQTETAKDMARRDFERYRTLRENGTVTVQQFEEKESDYLIKQALHRLSDAQVVKQKAALQQAEVRLGYATLNATWAEKVGSPVRYVGERYVDEGAMLKANDPICSVLDIDLLTAYLDVPESLYPRMIPGMPVRITVGAFPDESFMGILRARPAELSSTSRQARVEVDIPNADHRLAPGMFVEAQVVFREFENVPRLPVRALVTRDEQTGVYVVERAHDDRPTGDVSVKPDGSDGPAASRAHYRARFLPVRLGVVEGRAFAEVKSPAITAPVVVLGQHNLIDYTPVELNENDRRLVDERPPQRFPATEKAESEPAVPTASVDRPAA